jgi:predicted oxidoreductase
MSRIVLGLWRLAEWRMTAQERVSLISQALDVGVSTVDHADIYGDYLGESLFGEAMALAPQLRHRMKIVGKCGIKLVSANRPDHRIKQYDTSRAHILASVDASLSALGTDYLDLLLIHRPDPLMDADEIATAFQTLRRAGKVRFFGVSNFTPSQFDLLSSRVPLVTNQIELSPMHLAPLHDGTLDHAQRQRYAPMIWSALAGGRLFTEASPRGERLRAALARIGEVHGVSPTTAAYAWVLRHPSRPLILTGSRRIEAVREAVAATEVQLSREEWFSVWSASTGEEVP